MRSSTIVLAAGLLAAPLALFTDPNGFVPHSFALAQAADSAPTETLNGRPLTPAPVPDSLPGAVSPADRVAPAGLRSSDAGPVDSTPFSGAPTGTLSSNGGQAGAHIDPGEERDGSTPNLGK